VEHRSQRVFLFLILAQAAHSIEECVTKLYEVFAPARFVSSLVSNNLALGFVVANAVLVTFGLWCWAFPVRSGWRAARGLIWFLDNSGTGQWHQPLGPCLVARWILPRRRDRSAAIGVRFVDGRSSSYPPTVFPSQGIALTVAPLQTAWARLTEHCVIAYRKPPDRN
jgi:hypothetical protein